MQFLPKIAVITVTYNAEKCIEQTLLSILEQDYPNLELIVVDGKSSDTTVKIVETISQEYSLVLLSEKDSGVYDAMNKGAQLASGDWVIFMNAGDFFYSKDSISQIFNTNIENDISVIYGNAEFRLQSIGYIEKPSAIVNTNQYMPFSHQAVFVRRGIFDNIKFNLNFKIAADAAFFLQLVIDGYKFKYVDVNVCSYNALEGLSADNDHKRSVEIVQLQALLNKIDPQSKYFVDYVKDAKKKSLIRKILPSFLWIWMREKQCSKNHSTYRI